MDVGGKQETSGWGGHRDWLNQDGMFELGDGRLAQRWRLCVCVCGGGGGGSGMRNCDSS